MQSILASAAAAGGSRRAGRAKVLAPQQALASTGPYGSHPVAPELQKVMRLPGGLVSEFERALAPTAVASNPVQLCLIRRRRLQP